MSAEQQPSLDPAIITEINKMSDRTRGIFREMHNISLVGQYDGKSISTEDKVYLATEVAEFCKKTGVTFSRAMECFNSAFNQP